MQEEKPNYKNLPIEEKIELIKQRLARIEKEENRGRIRNKMVIPAQWRLDDDKIFENVLRKLHEGGWNFKRLAESEGVNLDSVNKFFLRFQSLLVDEFGFKSPNEISGGRRMK